MSLKCVKDKKGVQDFYCEILRHRNGVEVATTGLYAKQAKLILSSFFRLLPERKGDQSKKSDPQMADPSMIWDIVYEDQSEKGFLPRNDKKNADVVRAVLSLEGALASQFYP